MKNYFEKVAAFQIATDQPVNKIPTLLNHDYEKLRFDLMKEENQEYSDATADGNIKEVLDSCVDQMYVLIGTINSHGLGNIFEAAFNLVHSNNMTKVVDGKVIRDEKGKIVKPEGFVPVDLSKLLEPGYKSIESFYPIMEGDRFLCIKNYIMEDGEIAFSEGKEYESWYNNCILDNQKDSEHDMSGDGSEDYDAIHYFIKL